MARAEKRLRVSRRGLVNIVVEGRRVLPRVTLVRGSCVFKSGLEIRLQGGEGWTGCAVVGSAVDAVECAFMLRDRVGRSVRRSSMPACADIHQPGVEF